MERSLEVLQGCPLFDGIAREDIGTVLQCLGAKTSRYGKGETIIAEGEPAKYVGIVLSGAVQIVQVDYFGNRSIVAGVGPAGLFGESFACVGAASAPVSAVAAEPADYLGVDRSGLSVEIGKLRRLGLIDAEGKRFKILKKLES